MLSHPHSGYTAELLTNARLDPRTLGLTRASVDYSSSPILTARHLAARYDNSAKTVLSDINLDIYPHEILGLIGSSGCGKTTLVSHLNAILAPQSGEIIIHGKDGILSAGERKDKAKIRAPSHQRPQVLRTPKACG